MTRAMEITLGLATLLGHAGCSHCPGEPAQVPKAPNLGTAPAPICQCPVPKPGNVPSVPEPPPAAGSPCPALTAELPLDLKTEFVHLIYPPFPAEKTYTLGGSTYAIDLDLVDVFHVFHDEGLRVVTGALPFRRSDRDLSAAKTIFVLRKDGNDWSLVSTWEEAQLAGEIRVLPWSMRLTNDEYLLPISVYEDTVGSKTGTREDKVILLRYNTPRMRAVLIFSREVFEHHFDDVRDRYAFASIDIGGYFRGSVSYHIQRVTWLTGGLPPQPRPQLTSELWRWNGKEYQLQK